MGLYREQGVVLRSYKLGETDRIVHVLTPGRGKVRAVAKGVRRPGSRFGGRLESFSHVDLQLYEGRNLDVVNQAELITSFAAVREDFALSACASVLAEAADRVAQEHERNVGLFLLLLDGLRALSRRPPHPSLIVDAYLLRLASIAGYHPYLEACASCGAPGPHAVFAISAGGLLCDACAPREAQPMPPAVLDLLTAFVGAEWDALPAVAADARSRRSAGALVSSFVTYHLGRPLRSMDLVPR
ncbi:MAG TPA: DNA repair protein RecO [Egibacteraceae bacterium]